MLVGVIAKWNSETKLTINLADTFVKEYYKETAQKIYENKM